MKNLLLFILFLVFVACRNSIESKESACPQYEKGTKEFKIDSSRNGLGLEGLMKRGNENRAINMNDYDTVYRYRGMGGWGEFDYICSIYKQTDTPQYKAQLLRQRVKYDTIYDVSEKNLSLYEWQYVKKRFEMSNFWCYKIGKEGTQSDPHHYYASAKEKDRKRYIFWQEEQHSYDTLRGLGMDMLELADYPMPYALVYYKKIKDSISVDVIPLMIDYNLVKNYKVITHLKGGKKHDGVYILTIHKKDFDKIDDIEMEMEFYNGKIRRTNEKKIQKADY